MDDDIGFGIMRVTRDQQWRPVHLLQPLQNLLLGGHVRMGHRAARPAAARDRAANDGGRPTRPRADRARWRARSARTTCCFPALSGRRWRRTLYANLGANLLRNLWAYVVIFCGHFPDGAEKFTAAELENETRREWYLRQMLGSANFHAGPVMAFMSGNLCYQIEHHLFPDLPSNRYAEIATGCGRCATSTICPTPPDPLRSQYLLTLRTIHKLALPDRFLRATSDDAPETASERKFAGRVRRRAGGGPFRGLRTALRAPNVEPLPREDTRSEWTEDVAVGA